MNGTELISEIVGKIAWPVCICLLIGFSAYLFRNSVDDFIINTLGDFFRNIKRIKIDKNRGVVIINQRLNNSEYFRNKIAILDQPISPEFQPKMDKIRMIAPIDPGKAIKEVWQVVSMHDPERPGPGVRITQTNPDEQGLFDNLRTVYETASSMPISATPEQAIRYAELGLQFASAAGKKGELEA